ncbi:MAG: MATE family efflux transporter [Actinobacteria bacterium]|nr:MATE family efflux transporter [Actinomycetota bacterium]
MQQETSINNPSEQQENRLGTAKVGKLLLEFSIPAIISMIFNALYNVIDSIFLGQAIGSIGIAVTTLALPIQILLMGFSMLAGQGGNALAAILLGQGEKEKVERVLGNTTFLLVAIAAIVALAAIVFIDPILMIVGTTEELMVPTKTFIQIICFGFIFQSIGMGLNNFLRTAGEPNRALYTVVLGTISCAVLNYLFVMVFGWGIQGSAYATIFGQFIGMVPVLLFFCLNRKAVFRLRLSAMVPDFRLQGKILILGMASFVMQVAATILSVVLNQLLVAYGAQDAIGSDGALSTIGVIQKIAMFSIMPIIGIILGAQPIIGFNYGARNWKRVKKALNLSMLWSTFICVFFWALVHLIPAQLVSLFGVEGALRDFAITALKVYMFMLPIVGFQIAGSSYFQSSGQPLKAAILELTRQVIFLLPLYVILPMILPALFGISGLESIVVSAPVSDVLSTFTTGIFVILEMKKLNKLEMEQTCPAS